MSVSNWGGVRGCSGCISGSHWGKFDAGVSVSNWGVGVLGGCQNIPVQNTDCELLLTLNCVIYIKCVVVEIVERFHRDFPRIF